MQGSDPTTAHFGSWVVERPIGRGAMATVYRCHHRDDPDRLAAIKVLHDPDPSPDRVARLAREVRLLRRLDHPGIVQVLESGLAGAEPWIALELVRGATLDQARPDARPADEVLELGLALADALSHAHRLGVWHRDVKPANVLVDADGRVRLVDFGIAHASDELQITDPERLAPGTVAYAPPEWFTTAGDFDPGLGDAYALGVLLFEQVTGERAFRAPAERALATVFRHKREIPWLDPGELAGAALRAVVIGLTTTAIAQRWTVARASTRLAAVRASSTGTEELPLPVPQRTLEPTDVFVGRETELREIEAALASGARLVTLTGPGGVGKTRLGLRLAARRAPDPVAVTDLGDVSDLPALVSRIARTLGIPLTEADPSGQLGRALAGRGSMLLVLDPVDRVLEVAREAVTAWLAVAPELSIVACSRARLRVSGERTFPIAPLATSDASTVAPAVELFVHRVRETLPSYAPDDAERADILRVVTELDGLPLAIELAVATVVNLPAEARRAALEVPAAFLSDPGLGTLRSALDASWALLSEAQRDVLVQASVFAGPFGLDAAEAVMVASGTSVLDALQALVDRSLLSVRRGEGAFSMLHTVRAWAEERLGADDGARLRRRHAEHYARLSIDETRRGPPDGAAIDNARACVAWAVEAGEVALALQAADLVMDSAFRYGPIAPEVARVEALLALEGGADVDRMRLKLRRVGLLERLIRIEAAKEAAEEALAFARAIGEPIWEGRALASVARVGWMRRDPNQTLALLDESVDLLREIASPREIATALALRANASWSLRIRLERARADTEEAVELLRSDPDPYVLTVVLGVWALAHEEGLERVVRLARRNGYEAIHLDALCMSGIEAIRTKQFDAARVYLERARDGARRAGFVGRQADSTSALAAVCLRERRYAEAERWSRETMSLRGEVDADAHPHVATQLGLAAAGTGRVDESVAWFHYADQRSLELQLPVSLRIVTLAGRSLVLAELGDRVRAEAALHAATALAEGLDLAPEGPVQGALNEAQAALGG